MGFFDNIFGSSGLQYPTQHTGEVPAACGTGPYHTPDSEGFFTKLLAPQPLPYPVPACAGPIYRPPTSGGELVPPSPTAGSPTVGAPTATAPAVQPAPTPTPAAGSGTAAPTATPAVPPVPVAPPAAPVASVPAIPPAVSPVTVVITMPPGACTPSVSDGNNSNGGTPTAGSPTPSTAVVPPAPNDEPPPEDFLPQEPITLSAVSVNPRFRAHHKTATETLIEDMTEECVVPRMMSRDASPLAFVVPDGCDSVEFSYGPIEVNPDHGHDRDLDLLVSVGAAKVATDEGDVDEAAGLGALVPGTALLVTIPWRAASFVNLSANHLRVLVNAKFFRTGESFGPAVASA